MKFCSNGDKISGFQVLEDFSILYKQHIMTRFPKLLRGSYPQFLFGETRYRQRGLPTDFFVQQFRTEQRSCFLGVIAIQFKIIMLRKADECIRVIFLMASYLR